MKTNFETRLVAVYCISLAAILLLVWETHPYNYQKSFYYILVAVLIALLFIYFFMLYNSLKQSRKSNELLARNQQLLQSIINNTSSLIYIKDTEGRFTLVNKEFERTYHMSTSELTGKTAYDIAPKAYADTYRATDQTVLNEGKLIEVEEDILIDGRLHHFYSIKFPLFDHGQKPYALGCISTDLTELITRRQLERQKEIAEITIQAQEKERTEIGKELHDNVNQLLASAKLLIEAAEMDTDIQDGILTKSKDMITRAIREVRHISHAIMPPSFEDQAFSDAIYDIAETINQSSKLHMQIELPEIDQLSVLDDRLKLALYRIIQEQANNIVKYSKARNASVTLELQNSQVTLTIADDGIGADLNKQHKGIGLQNIASRVELYNGEQKIITAPNKGFKMVIRFSTNNALTDLYFP